MADPIIDPTQTWFVAKLFGAIFLMAAAIFGYEHKRITSQGNRIFEIDQARQDKCMTKEQCITNRDYQSGLLEKIYAGQNVIHERIDNLYEKSAERREGDK